jgi:hypothetical protein
MTWRSYRFNYKKLRGSGWVIVLVEEEGRRWEGERDSKEG